MCNSPVVLEKLIELSSSGKVTLHECFLSIGGVLRINDDRIQGGDTPAELLKVDFEFLPVRSVIPFKSA